MDKFYKFLSFNNIAKYSQFDYSLFMPTQNGPGQWTWRQDVILCSSGWHVAPLEKVSSWFAETMWEVEGRGRRAGGVDKVAFEQIRFIRNVVKYNDLNCYAFVFDLVRRIWDELPDEIKYVVEQAEYWWKIPDAWKYTRIKYLEIERTYNPDPGSPIRVALSAMEYPYWRAIRNGITTMSQFLVNRKWNGGTGTFQMVEHGTLAPGIYPPSDTLEIFPWSKLHMKSEIEDGLCREFMEVIL